MLVFENSMVLMLRLYRDLEVTLSGKWFINLKSTWNFSLEIWSGIKKEWLSDCCEKYDCVQKVCYSSVFLFKNHQDLSIEFPFSVDSGKACHRWKFPSDNVLTVKKYWNMPQQKR